MVEERISQRHRNPASVFLFFLYSYFSISKKKYFSLWKKKPKEKKKDVTFFSSKFRVYTAIVCLWSNRCEKQKKIQVPAIVDYSRIVNCVKKKLSVSLICC